MEGRAWFNGMLAKSKKWNGGSAVVCFCELCTSSVGCCRNFVHYVLISYIEHLLGYDQVSPNFIFLRSTHLVCTRFAEFATIPLPSPLHTVLLCSTVFGMV